MSCIVEIACNGNTRTVLGGALEALGAPFPTFRKLSLAAREGTLSFLTAWFQLTFRLSIRYVRELEVFQVSLTLLEMRSPRTAATLKADTRALKDCQC